MKSWSQPSLSRETREFLRGGSEVVSAADSHSNHESAFFGQKAGATGMASVSMRSGKPWRRARGVS